MLDSNLECSGVREEAHRRWASYGAKERRACATTGDSGGEPVSQCPRSSLNHCGDHCDSIIPIKAQASVRGTFRLNDRVGSNHLIHQDRQIVVLRDRISAILSGDRLRIARRKLGNRSSGYFRLTFERSAGDFLPESGRKAASPKAEERQ